MMIKNIENASVVAGDKDQTPHFQYPVFMYRAVVWDVIDPETAKNGLQKTVGKNCDENRDQKAFPEHLRILAEFIALETLK